MPCRLLLKARWRAQDREDKVSGTPPGSIVGVFPENHRFGRREDITRWIEDGGSADTFPGGFYVVDCPDLDYETAKRELAGPGVGAVVDRNGEPVTISKFKAAVDIPEMRANIRKGLERDKRASVSRADLPLKDQRDDSVVTRV